MSDHLAVTAVAASSDSHPLIVTADPDLLDELLRIAGEAGVDVDVAPDAAAARRRYATAPLVLVGIDLAAQCARARLGQRTGVVLVGRHEGASPPQWDVAGSLKAEHLAALPAAAPWLAKRFTSALGSEAGRIVAVVGGRGGAGASVFAAGLAVTAAQGGLRTLLIDGDPLGGGVDLVLGWEGVDGLRWPALSHAGGRIDPPALVEVLPQRGPLVVLSWDRTDPSVVPLEAMAAALDAGRRGQDVVVVDLPRRLDDAAIAALSAADRGLLVVPAELRACAAAARVAAIAGPHCPSLAVVVRLPSPGGLKAVEVARALGLPLAGTLRTQPGLSAALERGEAPARDGHGPLAVLCRRVLTDLGVHTARWAEK